jgi:hypothetical protein
LINFSPIGSAKTEYRTPPYNRFCNTSHAAYHKSSSLANATTCTTGGFFNRDAWPGHRPSKWAAGAADIYARWSKHKYTASPRGQQADCHRFWESLYLKSVPIVLSSEVYYQNLVDDYFLGVPASKLPILFVDSWNNVTRELLETEWDQRFRQLFDEQESWPPPYLTLEHTRRVIEQGAKEEVSKRARRENPATSGIWQVLDKKLSSGESMWENRNRCYEQTWR